MAVVVQAELLANGLADLVEDGDVSGGLARMLIGLGAVAAVRAVGPRERMVGGSHDASDPP